MADTTDLLDGPLTEQHRELGATFAAFGGWNMPVSYSGTVAEHNAVRNAVGIFDVSHLGKALVAGPGAAQFCNATLSNDLGKIAPGKAQYTLCCNDSGGVVDDLIAYLRSDDDVFLIPNAANTAAVRVGGIVTAVTAGIAVITETDILGDRLTRPPKKRRKSDQFIAEVSALSEGDLVVHQEHGIGRYRGLVNLDMGDKAADTLYFAQAISENTLMLRNVRAETHAFLKLMAPLGVRLGPFMLQLGPRFGGSHLDVLRAFLRELSHEFQYAVEVRHPDYFDQGAFEASLHEVLREHDADRCIFDARCMHAGQAVDPSTAQAQSRKPLLPLRTQAVGRRPLVRFIAQNQIEPADDYLDGWVETLAAWSRAGLEPYFFTHTPDDRLAPQLARRVHERMRQALPELPRCAPFIGEVEAAARPATGQLNLF